MKANKDKPNKDMATSYNMIDHKKLAGAVIAGGQSRRMNGTNKLWLEFKGETLLERAASQLAQQTKDVVINADLKDIPEEVRPQLKYPVIHDTPPPQYDVGQMSAQQQGPLMGIYSVMSYILTHQQNYTHILTAPADAPFFPKNLATELITKTTHHSAIITPFTNDKPQPLFSLWPLSVFKALERFLTIQNNRKVMDFIESQIWQRVEIIAQAKNHFLNINTMDDWNRLLDEQR